MYCTADTTWHRMKKSGSAQMFIFVLCHLVVFWISEGLHVGFSSSWDGRRYFTEDLLRPIYPKARFKEGKILMNDSAGTTSCTLCMAGSYSSAQGIWVHNNFILGLQHRLTLILIGKEMEVWNCSALSRRGPLRGREGGGRREILVFHLMNSDI